MAKLTKDKLIAFLNSIGLKDVQLVDKEEETEFDNDTALQAVDAARKPIISQLVIAEEKGKIHKEVAGTVNRALKKQLAEITGIDKANIEELESQDALKTALEHYKTTMSGEKDAQAKIDAILAAHKLEKEGIIKTEIDKYTALNEKYTRREIVNHIIAAHKDAKGLPTKANIEKLAEQFYEANKNDVIWHLNGKNELELRDPANPETVKFNKTNTNPLKLSDMIQPHYEGLGLWSTDTRDVNALTAAKEGGSKDTPAATTAKDAPSYSNYPQGTQEWAKQFAAPAQA